MTISQEPAKLKEECISGSFCTLMTKICIK